MAKPQIKTKTEPKKSKVWEVKISGSYRGRDKKYHDFVGIEGVLPYVPEEFMLQLVRKRYAIMWLAKELKDSGNIKSIREVWIDSQKKGEAVLTYIGKNIAEMTPEELQDVATACDLRVIPVYRSTSLRPMQNIAYAAYAKNVLHLKPKGTSEKAKLDYRLLTDHRADGFNLMKNPAIIVGGAMRRDDSKKVTNDEYLDMEETITKGNPKTTLTMDELKMLADQKNISYDETTSFDELFEELYG